MAGLQAPLSTLRLAPRDALRMTRGQRGLLFLYCEDFHLLLFAQSPGALACFRVRIVSSPHIGLGLGMVPYPGPFYGLVCTFRACLSERPIPNAAPLSRWKLAREPFAIRNGIFSNF